MAQDIGPLDWRIPIVTEDGKPTSEFQRRWATQISNNSRIGLITTGSGAPPVSPAPSDGEPYIDISTNPYTLYVGSGGTWHAITDINALLDSISSTHGSVLFRGSTDWQSLPPGTSGQFLKTNGAGADPSWATGGGGSSLLTTTLQRTTSQSIATSTDTTVSWDTTAVNDDVGAFSGGSPTILTVPSGYTKARATMYGIWASSSIGARRHYLLINGTIVQADFSAAQFESGQTSMFRWFTVASGNTISFQVRQNSGGNLNFAPTGGFATPATVQVEWAP